MTEYEYRERQALVEAEASEARALTENHAAPAPAVCDRVLVLMHNGQKRTQPLPADVPLRDFYLDGAGKVWTVVDVYSAPRPQVAS
jgi:hypothetical protein